jgi:transportin-3
VLLLSPDTPDSARTFAAQTFRAKVVTATSSTRRTCLANVILAQVTFDLHQLDSAARAGLRNTLLTALQRYAAGPRVVLIQLCLALAGLALQMPDWDGVVPGLIQSLGQNPATVPALLEFLTVLPEEVTNGRIPISVSR